MRRFLMTGLNAKDISTGTWLKNQVQFKSVGDADSIENFETVLWEKWVNVGFDT